MHTHNEIIKYRPLALYACEDTIDLFFNSDHLYEKTSQTTKKIVKRR